MKSRKNRDEYYSSSRVYKSQNYQNRHPPLVKTEQEKAEACHKKLTINGLF